MWRALLENFQKVVPGAEWIAALHVGAKQPNGLGADDLGGRGEHGRVEQEAA